MEIQEKSWVWKIVDRGLAGSYSISITLDPGAHFIRVFSLHRGKGKTRVHTTLHPCMEHLHHSGQCLMDGRVYKAHGVTVSLRVNEFSGPQMPSPRRSFSPLFICDVIGVTTLKPSHAFLHHRSTLRLCPSPRRPLCYCAAPTNSAAIDHVTNLHISPIEIARTVVRFII